MNEQTPSELLQAAPPAPATPWGFGLRESVSDQLGFFHRLVKQYGDVVHWRSGLLDIHVINHPDDLKKILGAGSDRFPKDTLDYRVLEVSLGQGLVTNDGPAWTRQRKLMQPMFHNRAINPFDAPINELTDRLAERYERLGPGEVAWVDRDMGRLTFEIVGMTLFGTDIERYADAVAETLEVINVPTHELKSMLLLWPWLPLPHTLRVKSAVKKLDAIVYELIEQRRRQGSQRDDMLDRLLAARDEDDGRGMSERQIRDEVVTMLLAGHETSSNALAWTLYLLGKNPDAEAKLLEELQRELGGRPAMSADLPRLPYLKQVVQESMRVLPPVWAIARRSVRDEIFGGFRVPAGSYLMMSQWVLHRHEEFWPDPERFDPDRFNPQRTESRHSYCYLPFAAGPRTCIGLGMAMLEIQLVLANLLQRFRFEVAPGHRIEPAARVTLKPRYGMPMRITRRTG